MLRIFPFIFSLLAPIGLLAVTANAQIPDAAALFEEHCASCHLADVIPRALAIDNMRAMPPEAIIAALTNGPMQQQGMELNVEERQLLAEYITGRAIDAAPNAAFGACAPALSAGWPGLDQGPQWNGWGGSLVNQRHQPLQHALLDVEGIPRLTLKWVFGFPNADAAYAQPTLVGGRLFLGSQRGIVYALDSKTGCTHWSFEAQSSVRSAMTVARLNDGRHVVFFGDYNANVYALDANTGAKIWQVEVDEHEAARITGAPVLYGDRLYIPVSSSEELLAADPEYPCCTFRGSLVALEIETGRLVWKSFSISEEPRPRGRNPDGAFLMGPAGAALWSTPTIDAKRELVYVTTGNAYTEPAADTSDSVIALDIETGVTRWVRQFTEADVFVQGCRDGNANCPSRTGPDFDCGASPALGTLEEGRDLLVVGQKSGFGYGLDPEAEGEIVWQRKVGQGDSLGGIEWGFTVDGETAYFPNSDRTTPMVGGLTAVRIRTGERIWSAGPQEAVCAGCTAGNFAAVTSIPGAIFSGSYDGAVRAYSMDDGSVVWEYNTNGEYETVNGLMATGGSINGAGPVIVDGMLYVNSGYGIFGGRAGNVLLAFGIE